MSDKIFDGTSKIGDFNEALSIAIEQAKEKLMTDHVKWELIKISGINGGYTLESEIEVIISAEPFISPG
jgi:hypothetical protein